MLEMSKKILKEYEREGFVSMIIYGAQSSGKTSYALHIGKEVYGSWEEALNHLFFSPLDALNLLDETLEKGERVKLIIMDDAGMWLSKYEWWDEGKIRFSEFYEIVRSVCTCILFTSTNLELLKSLIGKIWYRAKVQQNIPDNILKKVKIPSSQLKLYNLSKIYRLEELPSGKKIVKYYGFDIYPRYYPDWVKKEYEKIRFRAVKDRLERTRDAFEAVENARRLPTPKEYWKEVKAKIIEMAEKGVPKTQIARELGITKVTVYNVLKKSTKIQQEDTNSL